jgi:hypothetical protein
MHIADCMYLYQAHLAPMALLVGKGPAIEAIDRNGCVGGEPMSSYYCLDTLSRLRLAYAQRCVCPCHANEAGGDAGTMAPRVVFLCFDCVPDCVPEVELLANTGFPFVSGYDVSFELDAAADDSFDAMGV